jgi:hypothetical protein
MPARRGFLNYTTKITAEKTISEIHAMLRNFGATSIKTDYQDKEAVALSFMVATKHGDMAFRLPANVPAVEQVLWTRYVQRRGVPRASTGREQAARVAWRVVKDWLEAQLALIETEMVRLDQVLLPYMITGEQGETVYQLMEQRQFQALPPGKQGGTE